MRRRVKKTPRDAAEKFDKGIEQTEQAIDKAIESIKEKKRRADEGMYCLGFSAYETLFGAMNHPPRANPQAF